MSTFGLEGMLASAAGAAGGLVESFKRRGMIDQVTSPDTPNPAGKAPCLDLGFRMRSRPQREGDAQCI